ncbi:MAG TPA: glycoside hydrolase family 78 protein [Bryobacteraceae bacterium]
MLILRFITMAALAGAVAPAAPAGAGTIRPEGLRCEYRGNPLGIDERVPRLSWRLVAVKPGSRGLAQSAYRVLAASTEAGLRAGKGDLWDTGKVRSDASAGVEYAGKPLASGMQVFWKVRVWDQQGRQSGWSGTARWSMGLLSPADWKARWIGVDESPSYEHPDSVYHRLERAHWISGPADAKGPATLRASFAVPVGRPVRRAFVVMVADPRYEFSLNGVSRIRGASSSMPDFLDLTAEIKPGENTVSVSVPERAEPAAPGALIGVIHVEFANGEPLEFTTASAWKTESGAAVRDLGRYGVEPWGRVGFKEERALAARMLRKEFNAPSGLRRATAYVAGLGLSELYLNGRKAGDQVLSPGLTDYDKHVQYVTYDVTREVLAGKNAAGLILGNGRFWAPRASSPIGMRSLGYPRAICQIELEFANGRKEIVATDASWKLTREGPIRANNEFDGETYDARREMPGWSKAGFDDSKWEPAQLVQAPAGAVVAQMAEPLRVVTTLKPVKVTETRPGVFVYDMGQNMVGWCRMKVSGPAGTLVSLRHAETLTPDGSLYLDNLRTARALDYYVLKGAGAEVWEPRFTYHGFRYVEVRGYPGKPPLEAIEGRVVHDDMRLIADFKSSNELLNQLHHNILWGVRGNYRSIPTDCPQRDERQGWLGDRSMVSRSESYLFDIAAFYTKWHRDLVDSQRADGAIPDVSPTFWVIYNDDITWPSTFLLVPSMLREQYGDQRVIKRAYPSMKKWADHMLTYVKDDIIAKDTYADWCVPPENPKLIHSEDPARRTDGALIATAYFQYMLDLTAGYARIAGREQDASGYEQQAARLRAGFVRKFYHPERANYGNGSQTSSILPLALGITSEADRAKVVAELVRKMDQENLDHVGVGLIGAQWLMRSLSDSGHADLAYRIATQTTYPGWGYMIKQGATTIWELWNGNTADPAMNSGNHVMQIGDLGIWMYAYLGGIRPDPRQPGFRKITLRPVTPAGLDFVSTSHDSMYGKIVSNWKREGGSFAWHVTVPPNTTALAYVPAGEGAAVLESGHAAERALGVKFVKREGGAAVYELGSGEYSFESKQ